jgi:uncharacterized protein (DUF2384 family)
MATATRRLKPRDNYPPARVARLAAHEPTLRYAAGGNLSRDDGVDRLVGTATRGDPLERIALERHGVPAALLQALAKRLALPMGKLLEYIELPKATAAKKIAEGGVIAGTSGQALIAIARLLGIAWEMQRDLPDDVGRDFDVDAWLGRWLGTAQPALAGHAPGQLLSTPTGLGAVVRVLGAIQSGAYQ